MGASRLPVFCAVAFFLLLHIAAADGELSPLPSAAHIDIVVIGSTTPRFESTERVLKSVGLNKIRRHHPQRWYSELIHSKWNALHAAATTPPSQHDLRVLSLTDAHEAILSQAIGEAVAANSTSDRWLLVFEDDIALGAPVDVVRGGLGKALELGHSSPLGIVTLGTCSPHSCTQNFVMQGVEFARCSSICSHAIAYNTKHLLRARQLFTAGEAVDVALLRFSEANGGIWSAGINMQSTVGHPDLAHTHHGLFQQDQRQWESIIG